jgi:hypothetical protein
MLQDLDGDGQVDALLGRVPLGPGKMLRSLGANSIAVDLELYRLEDGVFPDEPDATLRVRPDVDPLGRRGPFFPAVLLGDVNGDGRPWVRSRRGRPAVGQPTPSRDPAGREVEEGLFDRLSLRGMGHFESPWRRNPRLVPAVPVGLRMPSPA